jgi:N-acyl-D-amino-acid deacylase
MSLVLIREEGVLALRGGIRKLTGLQAEYLFRFKDRGVLREGYWADIVLFLIRGYRGYRDFAEPPPIAARYRLCACQRMGSVGEKQNSGGKPRRI